MEFNELGGNSCSSLLIEDVPHDPRVWDNKLGKFVQIKIEKKFWDWFKEAVEEWDDDQEYPTCAYAYFVIYLTDKQVLILGDFLLSIGFSRTPSVLAPKTGQKCSLWFAEVSVVLKKLGESGQK